MAQANEFNYLLAKTAWMSSGKYLLLLKKLIESCDALEQGNLDKMMNEGSYKDYADSHDMPPQGQSDARSLIPFIYSLYNSVEQLLLAYYYASFPNDRLTFVPTFERLQEKFEAYGLSSEPVVNTYVEKYAKGEGMPELLNGLLEASGYTVDHLKGTRRALENNSLFKVLDEYQPYFFTSEQGKVFFTEVYNDVNALLEVINGFISDIDDDGNVGETVAALKVSTSS